MNIHHIAAWTILIAGAAFMAPSWSQTPPQTSWPEPKYEVRVDESVMVPMRDGVRLSTDLYFPTSAGGKLPVILIRTPYDKVPYRKAKSVAYQFARQGYIVAAQDTRGRYASEGNFTPFAGDVTDGYDPTDWLSNHSSSPA